MLVKEKIKIAVKEEGSRAVLKHKILKYKKQHGVLLIKGEEITQDSPLFKLISKSQYICIKFENCKFIQVDFNDFLFNTCGFEHCYFSNVNFIGTRFINSILINNEFYRCRFIRCRFEESDFRINFMEFSDIRHIHIGSKSIISNNQFRGGAISDLILYKDTNTSRYHISENSLIGTAINNVVGDQEFIEKAKNSSLYLL